MLLAKSEPKLKALSTLCLLRPLSLIPQYKGKDLLKKIKKKNSYVSFCTIYKIIYTDLAKLVATNWYTKYEKWQSNICQWILLKKSRTPYIQINHMVIAILFYKVRRLYLTILGNIYIWADGTEGTDYICIQL